MSYQNKLIGVLCLVLLPYFILIGFCHPSGDDFSYAVLGTKQDLFSALLDEYKLWNGRYTSNIFVLKNPLVFKDSWLIIYRYSIAGILFFGLFSSFFFFNYFLREYITSSWIIVISLLFLLLNLFQMPILSEGTYWYTGVVTYQLANSFALFYLIGLHRFTKLNNRFKQFLLFFGLCLSIILIAGFNEVIMLLMLVFHFVMLAIQFQRKSSNRFWFLGFFLASLLGFIIVYFAPGNKVRESYFIGESHRLGHSLLFTSLQMIRFVIGWFSSGVLLMLSLVYLSVYKRIHTSNKFFQHHFYKYKWITMLSLFAVLFLAIFPAYWSTGIMGQHRTVNTAYFFFILLWFVNLSIWSETKLFQNIQISTKLKKIAVIISLLILAFTNNTFTAWKDLLTNDALMFDIALKRRYHLLNSISKQDTRMQEILPLIMKPKSLFIYDISKDPRYFPNTCYKSYWKLNAYLVAK